MTHLKRWSPLDELSEMQREFKRTFGRLFPLPFMERRPLETEWMPDIDMFVKGDDLVIRAEIPGIDPKDVSIEVTDDTLVLKGERKASKEAREEDYYRSEMSYGSFLREISIPSGVDPNSINAVCDKGILEITIPKAAEKEKPRKVSVQVKAA